MSNFKCQISNKERRQAFRSDSGQALLIVVLIMVVFLTIGLSVVSRSIVNVKTASDQEKSQRAFSAAEAGIDEALQCIKNSGSACGITSPQTVNPNGATAQIQKVTVSSITGNAILLNNGNQILKDDGYDLWLANSGSSSTTVDYSNPQNYNLTLYWGDPSKDPCSNAALEVIVISGTKAAPTVQRFAYDGCLGRASNNFTQVSQGSFIPPGTGKSFLFSQLLPSTIIYGLLVRVVPLYFGSAVGVSSGAPSNSVMSNQGQTIDSTGASGDTQRKVRLFQGYPQLSSEFFQYILFQPATL